MTSLVTLWGSAAIQIDIDATSITHTIAKNVTPHQDSDGVNRWQEDNRYVESWIITGTVSLADKEDLTATAKLVTDTVNNYPKLRVYDKSTNPYYTDYAPVRLISAEDHRLNDDEYQVTVRLSR